MQNAVTTNIAARLDMLASSMPDKPAILFPSGRGRWRAHSYAELRLNADRVAWQLRRRGIAPGTRAAVMVRPGLEFVALALGMLKAGTVPVLVDPAIGLRAVGRCLEDAAPQLFIGDALGLAVGALCGWGRKSVRSRISMRSLLERPAQAVPGI